eukprot:2061368-Prorocentrum_lima.AAC.1
MGNIFTLTTWLLDQTSAGTPRGRASGSCSSAGSACDVPDSLRLPSWVRVQCRDSFRHFARA